MGKKKKNRGRQQSAAENNAVGAVQETELTEQPVPAVEDAEEPAPGIDISKYDRTENLEMTDPAQKTVQIPKFTGRIEMTGTFEKLEEKTPEIRQPDVTLEMTKVPESELGKLKADDEDSDEPYSPDSFGRSESSHHHHHHHSSSGSGESHSHRAQTHTHDHSHSHSHSHSSAEKPTAAAPAAGSTGKKKKAKEPEVKPLKPLFRIANIIYPAVVFAAVTVMFIALPRPETSETEQRSLAKFPEFSFDRLMSGEYTNGITDYFNDAVPFRDDLKRAAAQVRSWFGISDGENVDEIVGPIAAITEEDEPEVTFTVTTAPKVTTVPVSEEAPAVSETTAVTTAEPPVTTAPETTEQPAETTKNINEIAEGVITNGQVVTKLSDGHWWAMSLFGGGKGTVYAGALNSFKEALGDDVAVYSMVVPTAGEYYLPEKYAPNSASHQKSIDSIDSQLEGVISVPASLALWEHTDEPIYTRTDHHWQPLGAYYSAKCFAETAGVPFADISTMEQVDVPGYMGTMYSFTESANLLSDPETFTYYKPTNSYTTYYYSRAYNFDYQLPFFVTMPTNGSYSTFMGGDDKIVRITTDAGTGRKLVVFKDSYGNAEIPFYFGSFDEIWVCDMRYFDLNAVEFVQFTGATDLLFTMCTFSAVGTNANHLYTILNNPVTGITEPLNR